MGQDAFMEPLSSMVGVFQCKVYLLLLGACSGLKVAVPSHTVHGMRGHALYLPVHYGFHTPASDIQIIWLFERAHTMPKYLLGSVNKSVVPDLEYQHKFTMMPPNASLLINPLQFTDEGNYIVKVNIQGNGTLSASQKIQVTVDDGPYGLRVNSDKGLKVGEVFTVDIGEAILFDCSADSYPPNTYSWIQKTDNTTYVIKHGPHLEVASEKIAQKTTDYMCCAYNNVTGRRDEAHFTVIITSVGIEKLAQKGKSLSPLASITGISLFLILSMGLLLLWKKYQPYKVIKQKLEGRPETEYRKPQTFSGHEDALDDFGIYEFVAFPDASGVPRMPTRSTQASDGVPGQDLHSTIYEVIQHIPAQQQDHPEFKAVYSKVNRTTARIGLSPREVNLELRPKQGNYLSS
ncbi:HEPACAM family member 2 isoform X7 [Phacochoerus africanus]|uniref:HEPACAM family member 2 isoform X7 n=1 Tax=Phacochoerus africanus TaxID=41426 RepID=UPI001FD8B533|nr:HEPACAM family member 2 isoform X7 [Phacochoerus africanus]